MRATAILLCLALLITGGHAFFNQLGTSMAAGGNSLSPFQSPYDPSYGMMSGMANMGMTMRLCRKTPSEIRKNPLFCMSGKPLSPYVKLRRIGMSCCCTDILCITMLDNV